MESALAEAPRARLIDLEARGGAMAALDFGDPGRPVDIVFVHANGFNARTYRTILEPLAEDLRILAVDQRGHGRSGGQQGIHRRRLAWCGAHLAWRDGIFNGVVRTAPGSRRA